MTSLASEATSAEMIGIVPAGGEATRLAPLPCSKELLPIGFRPVPSGGLRPKVISHYLLESMRSAGAKKAYIILRNGKWDIPAYFGSGSMLDMHLAYLVRRAQGDASEQHPLPYGAPYTLDEAYPFIQHATIVFGFPDIVFEPNTAFSQLLAHLTETKADIVLGLFPAQDPRLVDMVEFDDVGRVRQIVIKPEHTDLVYSWIIAVWTPVFTHYMHRYLDSTRRSEHDSKETPAPRSELYVGDVVRAAIADGFETRSVVFPEGSCTDIGTPEAMVDATRRESDKAANDPRQS